MRGECQHDEKENLRSLSFTWQDQNSKRENIVCYSEEREQNLGALKTSFYSTYLNFRTLLRTLRVSYVRTTEFINSTIINM